MGARVEHTQADIGGLATNFVALTRLANDATQYGVATAGTATVSSSSSYTDILPNLSFKWSLREDLTARFAVSQTMTRPTLEQLSPVTTLVTLRPGNFAAASGTPDLKPFQSNNLDLSFEFYYGRANSHFCRRVLQERGQLHRAEPDDRCGEQRGGHAAARSGDRNARAVHHHRSDQRGERRSVRTGSGRSAFLR